MGAPGSTITNSYSVVAVSGNNYLGGITGGVGATATSTYWSQTRSGQTEGKIGTVTEITDEDDWTDEETYVGWDFDTIWYMGDDGLPKLRNVRY